MPRSYTSIVVHVIFSTYERRPLLRAENRDATHAYLGGIAKNLGVRPIAIGGIADHVHVLAAVPSTITIGTLVDKLKANSSKWLGAYFAWQRGFSAFSVSPAMVPRVVDYIRTQERHHKKIDFREEFVRLLEDAGVNYDPRYLFL